jgi:hypothetical protein
MAIHVQLMSVSPFGRYVRAATIGIPVLIFAYPRMVAVSGPEIIRKLVTYRKTEVVGHVQKAQQRQNVLAGNEDLR